ncbi:MAG: nicotinate-nicotinamide nucleotide adenylyltransferase, partial [Castellaniella sp.]
PGLRVNPIELHRAGVTYTIDTLAALPATARYTWILGSDQLANFCTWHRWRELLQHVRLAVAERPGTPVAPSPELAQALPPDGLVRIPFTPQPISATAIRRDLAAGRPVDAMLPPRVLDYIHAHRLYLDPNT